MERGLSLSIPSAEADGNRRESTGNKGKQGETTGMDAKLLETLGSDEKGREAVEVTDM